MGILNPGSSFFEVFITLFVILVVAEIFTLYLHKASFTKTEILMVVLGPLFYYVSDIGKIVPLNVPLINLGDRVIGINIVGFIIPVAVSLKILIERRITLTDTCVVAGLTALVTYFYTYFDPATGIVTFFFAIPPILAAGIAVMLREYGKRLNTPLLCYVGGTLGVLIGADILRLPKLVNYPWNEEVFIVIGGMGVMDSIFLAGIVALFSDIVLGKTKF